MAVVPEFGNPQVMSSLLLLQLLITPQQLLSPPPAIQPSPRSKAMCPYRDIGLSLAFVNHPFIPIYSHPHVHHQRPTTAPVHIN